MTCKIMNFRDSRNVGLYVFLVILSFVFFFSSFVLVFIDAQFAVRCRMLLFNVVVVTEMLQVLVY